MPWVWDFLLFGVFVAMTLKKCTSIHANIITLSGNQKIN